MSDAAKKLRLLPSTQPDSAVSIKVTCGPVKMQSLRPNGMPRRIIGDSGRRIQVSDRTMITMKKLLQKRCQGDFVKADAFAAGYARLWKFKKRNFHKHHTASLEIATRFPQMLGCFESTAFPNQPLRVTNLSKKIDKYRMSSPAGTLIS